MIRNVGLDKMLVDQGSGLNILFTSTLKELRLTPLDLNPMDKPFFDIALGDPLVPLREISLPVTFGTIENYRTEYVTSSWLTSRQPTVAYSVGLH
jgi:hypothetical protein